MAQEREREHHQLIEAQGGPPNWKCGELIGGEMGIMSIYSPLILCTSVQQQQHKLLMFILSNQFIIIQLLADDHHISHCRYHLFM